jgi:hypothetical protein
VDNATKETLYYQTVLYYVYMQRMSGQALQFRRRLSPRINSLFYLQIFMTASSYC